MGVSAWMRARDGRGRQAGAACLPGLDGSAAAEGDWGWLVGQVAQPFSADGSVKEAEFDEDALKAGIEEMMVDALQQSQGTYVTRLSHRPSVMPLSIVWSAASALLHGLRLVLCACSLRASTKIMQCRLRHR